MQAVADVHATAPRPATRLALASAGSGALVAVQLVPDNVSITPWLLEEVSV